ncbi:MAG: bifunctional precorrin-2 dehydrogenase/sirohydrochlorin ferrochelatase [Flavisolibacter sp.]|jgi:siroheme synthase-like protein
MQEKQTNNLFPVFLKLENMAVLIVGAGLVGLEKLNAILNQSPGTQVRIVGKEVREEIHVLAASYKNVVVEERLFLPMDLYHADVVIIAVNDQNESKRIYGLAKSRKKLVNVADKPELCDFYMSSIIKKGNLKIAISTNGKSPTIAKRLKEVFNDLLPDELDHILDKMSIIRSRLSGDFSRKVEQLNHITENLIQD